MLTNSVVALFRVQHPNIAPLMEFFEMEDAIYLVME